MTSMTFPKNSVLFITYNRLDLVEDTFLKIREYKPERLYIASDGGKNSEDMQKVLNVRKYLEGAIDWECDVKVRYSEQNQGCKYGPFNAIEWFFTYEERGIIIEDDISPERDFWKYMDEMLERFQDNDEIMVVSGCNIMTNYCPTTKYHFTKYPNYWGWGTWKRAWRYMDINMKKYPQLKQTKFLYRKFVKNTAFSLDRDFREVYSGGLDAWDYAYTMAVVLQEGLAVMPAQSLVLNKGFNRPDGTHTNTEFLDIAKGMLRSELPEPICIKADLTFDELVDREFFRVNYVHEVVKKILPSVLRIRVVNLYRKFRDKK